MPVEEFEAACRKTGVLSHKPVDSCHFSVPGKVAVALGKSRNAATEPGVCAVSRRLGGCAAEICGLPRPHFGLIFRSFSSHSSHYAPQTIEKSSSNWHSPRSTHFYGADPWEIIGIYGTGKQVNRVK